MYPEYDICIWSATGLKWIEVKMRELRVSNHPDFKITCFLDCRCMIPVKTEKRGEASFAMPFLHAHQLGMCC